MDSINKSSLAESPFADTETNEFGFHMQIEDKDNPRWGDEYLEVFDDDMQLELNDKMGDPNKSNISPSNENYSTINFKMGEDSVYEKYDFNDYLIKKTDSFDNMKDISSTDPAKVVPISHHERLNHSNYGIAFDIKSEVKEEVELYSPGSDTYVLESDDSDLNIGREETIEVEEISISIQDAREKSQKMEEKPVVFDTKTAPTIDLVRELKKPLYDLSDVLKETANDVYPMPVLQGDNFNQSFKQPKPGLNLELEKISLEPVNMNTPATPDLDFMDLVNFIISVSVLHIFKTEQEIPGRVFFSNFNRKFRNFKIMESMLKAKTCYKRKLCQKNSGPFQMDIISGMALKARITKSTVQQLEQQNSKNKMDFKYLIWT